MPKKTKEKTNPPNTPRVRTTEEIAHITIHHLKPIPSIFFLYLIVLMIVNRIPPPVLIILQVLKILCFLIRPPNPCKLVEFLIIDLLHLPFLIDRKQICIPLPHQPLNLPLLHRTAINRLPTLFTPQFIIMVQILAPNTLVKRLILHSLRPHITNRVINPARKVLDPTIGTIEEPADTVCAGAERPESAPADEDGIEVVVMGQGADRTVAVFRGGGFCDLVFILVETVILGFGVGYNGGGSLLWLSARGRAGEGIGSGVELAILGGVDNCGDGIRHLGVLEEYFGELLGGIRFVGHFKGVVRCVNRDEL